MNKGRLTLVQSGIAVIEEALARQASLLTGSIHSNIDSDLARGGMAKVRDSSFV